ncbi:MAG: leucine-rich repeat-containing protein kinase family protein [Phormidesmis sp.]
MDTLSALKSGQLAGSRELKLSDGLSEFPLEILELADSLEILDLSNNHFSTLPKAFAQLKKLKIVFLNSNKFEVFPSVLAECPALSMLSFKGNNLRAIGDDTLSPVVRWLILTNNQIRSLPADIGRLSKLQKLMLAGNQLTVLPDEMAACQNLELIRLSANKLQTLPDWLFSLPKLSWLAYAGNPCCEMIASVEKRERARSLPTIPDADLEIGPLLGQGASGIIYKGLWTATKTATETADATPENTRTEKPTDVAVKLFKGEITSDGSPLDEMQACIAAGHHPNLVTVLGQLSDRPGLVFSFISPDYTNLGRPPSLESCTRDTYPPETQFTLATVLQIARGIASAAAHLHARGIMHGDLYAHNILVAPSGDSILGDFGAASFYDPAEATTAQALEQPLERLEVRAFGCLLEDLLGHCYIKQGDPAEAVMMSYFRQLQQMCMQAKPLARPLFSDICEALSAALDKDLFMSVSVNASMNV